MSGFPVDHIVIRMPDRDGLVDSLAAATGLPPCRGYVAKGEVASRGVRFAGGPFLDIFQAPEPVTALILRAPIADAEALAERQGWATRVLREGQSGDPGYDPPWSMVLFRRGQGLLTRIAVIDYAPAEAARWAQPDFAGDLYPVRPPPTGGARLARVWLGASDLAAAGLQLQALSYRPAGEVASAFPPGRGQLFVGPGADLVICDGADDVLRWDAETGAGPPRDLDFADAPRVVLDEAL